MKSGNGKESNSRQKKKIRKLQPQPQWTKALLKPQPKLLNKDRAMERSGRKKQCILPSLQVIPCVEIAFEYLEVEDILSRVPLVNSVFEEKAYGNSLWSNISRRKWSKWRESAFGEKFGFCFMDGASHEEISLKEEELDFCLRLDIRALLEECAGINFPYQFMVSETPSIYMNHILNWENLEDYALRKYHLTQTELLGQDIVDKYDSFKDYLVIGSGFREDILLNTRTWEVLLAALSRVISQSSLSSKERLFRNGGSFCEWFDQGTSLLDINENDKTKWQRLIKEKDDLDLMNQWISFSTLSAHCPILDKSDKDYAEDLAYWRSYYLDFFSAILKDEQLQCRFLRDVNEDDILRRSGHLDFDLEYEIDYFSSKY